MEFLQSGGRHSRSVDVSYATMRSMATSYRSLFVIHHVHSTLPLIFSRTLLRYVRLMALAVRLSSVCYVGARYPEC